VNPRVFPQVPSREMGRAVELGSTVEDDAVEDEAMLELEAILQSPKSSWQPVPQNESVDPQ
jgi:hypothetical protein